MGALTFTHSSGTVVFDGAGAITSNGNQFNNVTITNVACTLGDAASLASNLSITDAGGSLGCGANNLTVTADSTIGTGGTVSISTATYDCDGTFNATGGNITFTGAGNLLLGGGTITSLGDLSTDNGTVNYDSGGVQTIFVDEYNNLTVSGSGTKTTATGLDVNATLSVSGTSTFVASGAADITIGGALTIAGGAGWTKGTGTTTFDGATCSITDSNAAPVDLGKITVD